MEESPDETARRRYEALVRLNGAAEKAKRIGNVSFMPEFVHTRQKDSKPPLARMVQGGRGGAVRLRLYLMIAMRATSPPYDIRPVPTSRTWAKLLGLPPDTGPRRVADAINWLHNHQMIDANRYGTPSLVLLNTDGSGTPYVRPITRGRYVGVPIAFWTNGWILDLSPTAIALFLVLLELQGGYKEHRYVERSRKQGYGLSSDTWTRARHELEQCELLSVRRVPQDSDSDALRMRNTYFINIGRLAEPLHTAPPIPDG